MLQCARNFGEPKEKKGNIVSIRNKTKKITKNPKSHLSLF